MRFMTVVTAPYKAYFWNKQKKKKKKKKKKFKETYFIGPFQTFFHATKQKSDLACMDFYFDRTVYAMLLNKIKTLRGLNTFDAQRGKMPIFCHKRTAKAQISVGSRAVWSEHSLFIDVYCSVH